MEREGLASLPFQDLKKKCKELGIATSNKDKKVDIVAKLEAHVAAEVKREMAEAEEPSQEIAVKVVEGEVMGVIPEAAREALEQLAEKGLKWEICKVSNSVTFKRDLLTCANLDQPANTIIQTARSAFSTGLTLAHQGITGNRPEGRPVEWA